MQICKLKIKHRDTQLKKNVFLLKQYKVMNNVIIGLPGLPGYFHGVARPTVPVSHDDGPTTVRRLPTILIQKYQETAQSGKAYCIRMISQHKQIKEIKEISKHPKFQTFPDRMKGQLANVEVTVEKIGGFFGDF